MKTNSPRIKHIIIFVLKKLCSALLVIFLAVSATFWLMHMVKGDPYTASVERVEESARQQYIQETGLDQPVYIQYFRFLKQLITFDNTGVSLIDHSTTVTDTIRSSLPASTVLGLLSVLIGTVIGVALGIVSAYSRRPAPKYLISFFTILCISVPAFVLAPFLQFLFSVKLHLLPVSGWGNFAYVILPVACMLPHSIASVSKFTATEIAKVRGSQYYFAARQRGFTERRIFLRHIGRNISIPLVTVLVSSISGIVAGSFIVERIFSVPGIGRSFMEAINTRNYPIIIGLNVLVVLTYVVCRLAGDVVLGLLDPRSDMLKSD